MTVYAGSSGFAKNITVTTAVSVIVQADSVIDEATLPSPITVKANPGVGGTIKVEYRVSSAGTWVDWPGGTVSAITIYVLTAPVQALRLTATTSDGTVEISQ